MTLEFSLLGSVGVRRLDGPIDLGGPKQRALVAFLLLRSPDVVPTSDCLEAVWGSSIPDGAIRSLRTYVSNLRRILGPEITVESVGSGYRLLRGDVTVDIDRIGDLFGVGRRHADPSRRFDTLTRALDLWVGPPLADLGEHVWVEAEVERLERLRTELMVERLEAGLEAGEHRALLPHVEAAVVRHPLDERLTGLLMVTLYRAGRQVEALRLCQDLRDRLRDELGVDPTRELVELERRILSHDATLSSVDSPTNLPNPTSSFIGRTSELAELTGVVGEARLITLLGPGGVGKSRLAVEAGHMLRRRFRDGVWLCDLTTAIGPDAVDDVIGTAVGVQPRSGIGRLDAALEFLRPTSSLLIVDNCDHVLARASGAIARLLGGCPGVTVLATSRTALHVEGERVWGVTPLAVPEAASFPIDAEAAKDWSAIRLLLDRAPATFKFTDERVPVIGELVHRLDGLPLGLELAAARLQTTTPEEILGDLADRGSLASAGSAGQERHRSLERAVEWSFASLPDELKRVFAGLGVFASDFGADDAVVVSDLDGASARPILDALAERSLVVADVTGPSTRFRLLETMRAFALDRLDEREVGVLRSRHARHFASVAAREATRLNGSQEAVAVDVLSRAFADLRSGFRWAAQRDPTVASLLVASLPDFAYWRQGFEIAEWASESVDRSPDVPSDRSLCGAAARGAWCLGRFREASAYGRLGLAGAGREPISRSGHPGSVLADVALYEGRADETLMYYRTVLKDARAAANPVMASWALYYVSLVSTVLGLPGAVEAADESLLLAGELDNPTARSYATYAQALACKHTDPIRSEALFVVAAGEAGRVSNSWFGGIAAMEAASIKAVHADPGEAMASFGQVVDHWDRQGERTQMRLAWRYLLRALARAGRDEEAAVLIGGLETASGEARGSTLARPPVSVVEAVRDRLGHDRYVRTTVRGAAMNHAELVEHARRTIRAG